MKRTCRKWLACLIAGILFLSMMQTTVSAQVFVEPVGQSTADVEAQEVSACVDISYDAQQTQGKGVETFTQTYINPLYRDEISQEDLKTPGAQGASSEEQVAFNQKEYQSVEDAALFVREQMKKRVGQIVVKVVGDSYEKIPGMVAEAAIAHSGDPKEGDYLKWQYAGWQCEISAYPSDEKYYTDVTYTMTYYTTAKQEAEMDGAVASLMSELRLNDSSMNDYQKIKAIYDYLTHNVAYDNENVENNKYMLKHTAYAALMHKKAVCQGYAVLFYRMALECGIDSRVISGVGNGEAHGWNIVQLGDSYYNADATWDAGDDAADTRYQYFLKTDKNFTDHSRDEIYRTKEFYEAYPMAEVDYEDTHTHTHKEVKDVAVEATCSQTGLTEGSHCSLCGEVIRKQEITPIDESKHLWSDWQTIAPATVFEAQKQERSCTECKQAKETREIGEKLKKKISVTQSSLTMQTKQKTTAFKVSFANGDAVKSWKSSDTNVVQVSGNANGSCTITAQGKSGNAVITITLESGLKKTIKVKIQKKRIEASSIQLPSAKVTVKRGKTLTLKPVIKPLTSQSKVTYRSSNPSVVSVSSKGVMKGLKKGTATITVQAGKKKVSCTVTIK